VSFRSEAATALPCASDGGMGPGDSVLPVRRMRAPWAISVAAALPCGGSEGDMGLAVETLLCGTGFEGDLAVVGEGGRVPQWGGRKTCCEYDGEEGRRGGSCLGAGRHWVREQKRKKAPSPVYEC
jgi:hypothetical protein